MGWKLLEGKGYRTFEWDRMDEGITKKDIEILKESFKRNPENKKVTLVVPAGSIDFSNSVVLQDLELRKIKTREVYYRNIMNVTEDSHSSLEFIAEPTLQESLRCLSLILGNSDEASGLLDALYAEVKPDNFRIYIVRKTGEDAGFFIPHIEPYTESEGRIFYFGITPEYRGLGLGSIIHKFALTSLRQELKADSYIGSTDSDNLPMKRVFEKNGCRKVETIEIYSQGETKKSGYLSKT
ncbi:GNAT family N-acetyltransferase [Bacillus sp. SCS-153A]|uniref:GNAT family N-acetyltransferase n=1 Tax=Rossellomorea sedimentorum TaxID=3115294 RepID=UPI0039059A73